MAMGEAPDWQLEVEHAEWAPRDSCGEVVHDGRIWIMGGWFDSYSAGPTDVWSSADGLTWSLTTPSAGWRHGDLPTTVAHDGKMWLMGGWYRGRLEGASASNEVWASADGATWECVNAAAPWSPRLGAAGVVFRDRIWLLGGGERYFDGDSGDLCNDVWHSADGVTWELATAQAPWAPRAFHAALVFNDRLWVFGGGDYLPEYLGYNDVWSSADGVEWTLETERAAWDSRIWFSAVVYRGCMWLLGGWANDPYRNFDDVWYSADGVQWHELKTKAIWSPRHEHSVWVFDDRIWLAAGNAWPLVNDVWSLHLPEHWTPGDAQDPAPERMI
jgi:hypothetical protein